MGSIYVGNVRAMWDTTRHRPTLLDLIDKQNFVFLQRAQYRIARSKNKICIRIIINFETQKFK